MEYKPMKSECSSVSVSISTPTPHRSIPHPHTFLPASYTDSGGQKSPSHLCTRFPHEQFSALESYLVHSPKDYGKFHGKPVHTRLKPIQLSRSEFERVWHQYYALRKAPLPERIEQSLRSHEFNNWLYSDAQLLIYVRHMFIDLDLPRRCRFCVDTLEAWLLAVYRRYNDVPFHNFKHAFTVTQMMYCILKQTGLDLCFSAVDQFILLFSALSHDLDHPGFTNSYQINASSWLALRYNDNSPLENHHCAVAFDLIGHPTTNILIGLQSTESQWFRKAVIKCILATDMSTHGDHMARFCEILPRLIPPNADQASDHWRHLFEKERDICLTVMLILLKTCDISNEVRPIAVADPWLDSLLEEFFYQANAEKRLGLPVAAFMDPEKVTRLNSQVDFLRGVLIPLLECVATAFPQLKILENAAKDRIAYYILLQQQQEEEDLYSYDNVKVNHVCGIATTSSLQPISPSEPSTNSPSSYSEIHHWFTKSNSSNPIQAQDTRESITQGFLTERTFSRSVNDTTTNTTNTTATTTTTTSKCHSMRSTHSPSHCKVNSTNNLDTLWKADVTSNDVSSRKSSTGSMVVAST